MKHRIWHWLFPIVATVIVVCGMSAGVAANTGGFPSAVIQTSSVRV